jgi:hypothetical protein
VLFSTIYPWLRELPSSLRGASNRPNYATRTKAFSYFWLNPSSSCFTIARTAGSSVDHRQDLFQSGPGFVGKSQDVIEFICIKSPLNLSTVKKPLQGH